MIGDGIDPGIERCPDDLNIGKALWTKCNGQVGDAASPSQGDKPGDPVLALWYDCH
jgi:hypothetical protein